MSPALRPHPSSLQFSPAMTLGEGAPACGAAVSLTSLTPLPAIDADPCKTCRQIFQMVQELQDVAAERDRAQAVAADAQHRALQRLILLAALKDGGSPEHCLRVGALSALVAQAMGLPQKRCDMLFEAAPLHDLGKLGIPDSILLKPGRLSPEEWRIMRDHPLLGARLLEGSGSPVQELAVEIVLNHHEKWDGSGYPAGRFGTNTPLSARITAVVDFFDAVTSPRSDRAALADNEVFRLLECASGTQFEPAVVRAMFKIRPRLPHIRRLAAERAPRLLEAPRQDYWWRQV